MFWPGVTRLHLASAPTLDAPTGNQPDDHHNHDNYQDDMNEGADVENGESEKPQNQQNYCNSPKHEFDYTFRTTV
jgi:hypothetical protein